MRRSAVSLFLAVMCGCGPQEAAIDGEEEGLDVTSQKIVGGTDADIAAFPYQVALMDSGYFQFCGGTIIAADWVVTANHCVEGVSAASLRVGAGSSKLSTIRSTGQLRSVAQIVRYPGYVDASRGKDLALLRLSTPFDLSGAKVKAIGLATAAEVSTGASAAISGWGTLSAGGSRSPDTLQSATVNVVAQSTLQGQYGSTITADQLGASAPGRDSCQGDSGGPLVITANGQRKLAGVVSWGNGCADSRFAGVYARVPSFEAWIQQQIGGSSTPTTPAPELRVLVDQSNVSAARGGWVRYSVTVPAGAQSFTVVTQGGSGDADLYVRFGAAPSTTAFDCRPYTDGNGETCSFANPQAGTWEIGVRGYAAFNGLTVRATLP